MAKSKPKKTRMKHHYPDCQGGPTCNCDEREREEIEREMSDTELSECKCTSWCRDGWDMLSPHHPRCEHFTVPPEDPRLARFGEAIWKYICNLGGDFCAEEISEDILPLAQSAGLCCRVHYDPAIHGDGIDAEPGDTIWWWGNELQSQQYYP